MLSPHDVRHGPGERGSRLHGVEATVADRDGNYLGSRGNTVLKGRLKISWKWGIRPRVVYCRCIVYILYNTLGFSSKIKLFYMLILNRFSVQSNFMELERPVINLSNFPWFILYVHNLNINSYINNICTKKSLFGLMTPFWSFFSSKNKPSLVGQESRQPQYLKHGCREHSAYSQFQADSLKTAKII